MNVTRGQRNRNRMTLILLLAVFVAPLLYAVWVYNTMERPARTKNHGTLVQPPVPLPADLKLVDAAGRVVSDAFTGKWTLVMVGSGSCDAPCRLTLYKARQSRLAQGEAVRRVQRVYLLSADTSSAAIDTLHREHPDLRILRVAAPDHERLAALLGDDGSQRSVYVVDPLGNYMMRFDGGFDAKGLAQDLRLLLRASQIG